MAPAGARRLPDGASCVTRAILMLPADGTDTGNECRTGRHRMFDHQRHHDERFGATPSPLRRSGQSTPPARLLSLQTSVGNRAVSLLVARSTGDPPIKADPPPRTQDQIVRDLRRVGAAINERRAVAADLVEERLGARPRSVEDLVTQLGEIAAREGKDSAAGKMQRQLGRLVARRDRLVAESRAFVRKTDPTTLGGNPVVKTKDTSVADRKTGVRVGPLPTGPLPAATPANSGTRRPIRSGGGDSGGRTSIKGPGFGTMLGGLLTAGFVLATPLVKQWFAEHYLQKKWKAEERAMVERAILERTGAFNKLIGSRRDDIAAAQVRGEPVVLHVVVDTELSETDLGPAQTKATVAYFTLLFLGDVPIEWPLFQHKQGAAGAFFHTTKRSRGRLVFDLPL